MEEELRIGIVGTGGIGRALMELINNIKHGARIDASSENYD